MTAIETFTYHGDNDLMKINEGNNTQTQYLHGNLHEPSKLWRLQNNQVTTETLQRITFNSQIACATSNSGLIKSNNNSTKKGGTASLANPNIKNGTIGYAIISNCNSPSGGLHQAVSLNRSTYQQQKEAMQRVNIQKLNGGGTVRKQKKKQ